MLLISKVKIHADINKLNFCIIEDGTKKDVFFETKSENVKYFVDDRCDSIVVGLLNYAMRHNHDITCEIPISDKLYFNLTTVLIPNLAKDNKELHNISIKAPLISVPLKGYVVGTGISCGVDSLHTLYSAQKNTLSNYRVTHLLYNNVGQHGDGDKGRQLFGQRLSRPRNFAEEYGFVFIECNSNLQEQFYQDHLKSHTYTNLSVVMALGNLFKIYYYASSGIRFEEISLRASDTGTYDPILLPILSSSGIEFYSGGINTNRMDKIRAISEYIPSYEFLNVCFMQNENCCKCEKCIRTITALYAIGKLYKYKSVFNLEYFENHKNWYLSKVFYYHLKGHNDYKDIFNLLKKEIGFNAKIRALWNLIEDKCIIWLRPFKRRFFPNYHYFK